MNVESTLFQRLVATSDRDFIKDQNESNHDKPQTHVRAKLNFNKVGKVTQLPAPIKNDCEVKTQSKHAV